MANDWYWEDYEPGTTHSYGPITVSEAEIVAFARQFDPQPFHVDPAAAAQTPYGGLIASGWHTCGLMMRLLADHYLSRGGSLGSPGIDELRWPRPVRPGDQLWLRATVLESRRSQSKPDRGIVRTGIAMVNQSDETVLTLTAVNLIAVRPGSG
jgi:acyl dehydratase